MIKCILWDIDGTVLDFLSAEKASLKATFLSLGLGECTDEMVARYSKINQKYWERLERQELTKEQVLLLRFVEFLEIEKINGVDAKVLGERYENGLADKIAFFDNSYELISELKKEYKQYAVTNGAYSVQTKKLAKSGLDKLFDGVFISDSVGFEKPSKEFFDTVLSCIGPYNKNEIMIVGDSLTSDMMGGNNAGIKCCWYNRNHAKNNTPVKTDYEIHNLNEIKIILEAEHN
ncbi:MAG: YjjG family noncanonical pyrimidine nucleotidase [Eubacterium sp.]